MARAVTARKFPRLPSILIGAALACAIAAAASGPRLGARSEAPTAAVVAERTLRFEDRADGAVVALEGTNPVQVFEGEQGFLRGTLRGLARTRHLRSLSNAAPFELTAYADGRLTLADATTAQRIDLEAFGPTNAAVFAQLLEHRPTESGQPSDKDAVQAKVRQ